MIISCVICVLFAWRLYRAHYNVFTNCQSKSKRTPPLVYIRILFHAFVFHPLFVIQMIDVSNSFLQSRVHSNRMSNTAIWTTKKKPLYSRNNVLNTSMSYS